jgi:cation transport ATPase
VLYVGDGLNDFRAMNASSVSIALQHAPDPLLASASAVLGSNNLSTVVFSIPYCRRIARLTKRNEWFFLSATSLFGFGAIAGWLNPRVAISVLLGAYLIVWFQSYLLGSSILSSVKKRARQRISLKETQEDLAPYRNR